jgi:tripartite-type tricarboxylate transporter receptor subunit TctC
MRRKASLLELVSIAPHNAAMNPPASKANNNQGTKLVRIPVKAVGAAAALLMSAPALAGWEPTKPVEIVVAAGAGGASDQMARMMQAAIQKNNLMKQPMVVSLKGGASGAEALMYMRVSSYQSTWLNLQLVSVLSVL